MPAINTRSNRRKPAANKPSAAGAAQGQAASFAPANDALITTNAAFLQINPAFASANAALASISQLPHPQTNNSFVSFNAAIISANAALTCAGDLPFLRITYKVASLMSTVNSQRINHSPW